MAKEPSQTGDVGPSKQKKEPILQKSTEVEYLFKIINRYDFYIGQASLKASFLITIVGVILGTLYHYGGYLVHAIQSDGINNLILIVIGFGLVVALILALIVVFPITLPGNELGSYTSFIAFSSVARMKYEIFQAHHLSNDYDLKEDLLRQVHILAKITNDKFTLIKWAVWSLVPSIILLVLMLCIWGNKLNGLE